MSQSAPLQKTPVKVMLVDDSAIVRGLLSRTLGEHPEIHIAASAFDGQAAIAEIQRQPIDVVILDLEMPRMDGITALPELLKLSPSTKIIISSTLTKSNAEIGMRALSLGASDYISKPSSQRDKYETEAFYQELIRKILAYAPVTETVIKAPKVKDDKSASSCKTPIGMAFRADAPEVKKHSLADAKIYPSTPPRAIAIASSTGGPQALLSIFSALKGKLSGVPIFITQHMPPTFTTILASNLSQTSLKDCHEPVDGEVVKPGNIYLAPGDFHMVPMQREREVVVTLNQSPPVNFCRPAADPMIEALQSIYGQSLLLVVLTGMGSDGFLSAQKLHQAGGTVVVQDKDSCVVWGMPRAVAENQACKAVLALDDIPRYLLKACREA